MQSVSHFALSTSSPSRAAEMSSGSVEAGMQRVAGRFFVSFAIM